MGLEQRGFVVSTSPVDLYRKLKFLEDEVVIYRALLQMEEIKDVISRNNYAKTLMRDAQSIRQEVIKIDDPDVEKRAFETNGGT